MRNHLETTLQGWLADDEAGVVAERLSGVLKLGAACEALVSARHSLTTLHGLVVCDGAAPEERWTVDESGVLARIDAALSSGGEKK